MKNLFPPFLTIYISNGYFSYPRVFFVVPYYFHLGQTVIINEKISHLVFFSPFLFLFARLITIVGYLTIFCPVMFSKHISNLFRSLPLSFFNLVKVIQWRVIQHLYFNHLNALLRNFAFGRQVGVFILKTIFFCLIFFDENLLFLTFPMLKSLFPFSWFIFFFLFLTKTDQN